MAASPAIDLGEPLAALFKRARVADSLYRRYEGRLAELGIGDAGDLLDEVAEKGIGSLDIHDRQAEKLRQALLGRRGWGDAAAVLASLSGLSLGDTPAGVAAGDQAAGGGAAAGGEGRGGARPEEADGGACDAQAAEGGSGGGTEGSSLDPLEPALPESGDGTIAAAGGEEEVEGGRKAPRRRRGRRGRGARGRGGGLEKGPDTAAGLAAERPNQVEEVSTGGAAPAEGEESGAVSPDCSREVHTASLLEGEASMTARIESRDLESRAAGAQDSSFSSADHPEHESWRRRGGAAWWRAHWAQLNVGQFDVVEPCCLCGRPGSAGELWRAGAWRWANSTGRCAAPYLATTDDRWEVPGLRQAYVAHGMCGGLCQGWGCCEARGVAQPQDGSGEARGEGEGEGELSSDGDSDRSAGDPVWGSAALEDEWRAASLARQAVGDAAYAAAHAAGASRAEACDAAVRAVRLDEVEAQSSFLVRAGWYGSGRDGGGEGAGATAARNRRRRGARARAKEEEPEPGEDWEGEERPEEYAGLFDDP